MKLDTEGLKRAETHLMESAAVQRRAAAQCMDTILAAAQLIADAFKSGNKVLLCGNGGSAADCQHMATEFVSQLTPDFKRPGLPAIALTTDTSFLTAYSNDYEFDGVFQRQVQALGQPGDVLIIISTSGNSANALQAAKAADNAKMRTIVLTGAGGLLKKRGDISISVPSTNTRYIQESHLAIEHVLCDLVERLVYT
ncbi:MAG: SIS domain-containing protein [Dehalococcoidia bacterium]